MTVKLVIIIVNFVVCGYSMEKSNGTSRAVLERYKDQTPKVSELRNAENGSIYDKLFHVMINGQRQEKKQRPRRDDVDDYIGRELDIDEYYDRKHWTDEHRVTQSPGTTTASATVKFTPKKKYRRKHKSQVNRDMPSLFTTTVSSDVKKRKELKVLATMQHVMLKTDIYSDVAPL